MKYAHIVGYVMNTPWAITLSKLQELLSVLAYRVAGGTFTPDEIQARIGPQDGREMMPGKRGAVAVVPIRGVIAHRMGTMDESSGGTSCERIGAMCRQMMTDESVGTILLDIDSPGGTVQGVSELAAEIFAMRGKGKSIVALCNSLCASAAYWLASQAEEIVSIPSGIVGSIGIYTAHEDLSVMLEQEGVKVTLVSAGTHKTEGNPFEPLSDEAKAVMQERVNAFYNLFVKDVARGRGVSVADVKNGYGEGRALLAKDAKAAGLIDRIETMDATLARLMGMKPKMKPMMRAEESPLPLAGAVPSEALAAEAPAQTAVQDAEMFDAIQAEEENRARRLRML